MTAPNLSDAHVELLVAAAIDPEVAVAAGVRSVARSTELPAEFAWLRRHGEVAPGLVFPVRAPDGTAVHQYRPDRPVTLENGYEVAKYLFPKGGVPGINVHPTIDDRLAGTGPVWIVEGTKQYLAAVTCAPDDVAVVGVSGCSGWSRGGAPCPELTGLPLVDREVVVIFDADVATKRNVYDQAERLRDVLVSLGVAVVRFVRLPAGGNAGLDDYLASVPAERRGATLERLVAAAGDLPGRRPAKGTGGRTAAEGVTPEDVERFAGYTVVADSAEPVFFDVDGLRVLGAVEAVRERRHLAVGPDGGVWVYRDGIYVGDDHELVNATRELLGERWRQSHHNNIATLLAAELAAEGTVLPEVPFGSLIAVPNGMLDPVTGELHDHDPRHLAYARLAVEWDPTATCPYFDEWLVDRCGAQADDLLEAVALVLVPSAGQRKTPFLIGPTRSGKGTFLRIIEGVVGDGHRSSRTLHDLAVNRFAVADLVGKVLNSAGDLSDQHIGDLSMFKMLTGADSVPAERKFRDAFTFRNTALFIFSANTPPTVAETSRAYAARIRPYLFPHSYENAEDAAVERRLMGELPGVLVRLVEAVRRWHDRGGYAPVNPIVADLFARQSDPVAMFVAQVLDPDPDGFVASTVLHETFERWATTNGRSSMGRNKFCGRVDNVLGPRKRRFSDGTGPTGWHGWRALPEDDWTDGAATYAEVAPAVVPNSARSARLVPISPRENATSEEVDGDTRGPSRSEVAPDRAERADDPGHGEQMTLDRERSDVPIAEQCIECGNRKTPTAPYCWACLNTPTTWK
jgi:putative DNA primase/helicase